MRPKISHKPSVLRKLLLCDFDTGELTWRVRDAKLFKRGEKWTQEQSAASWNKRRAGKPAFTALTPHGYNSGVILGVSHQAHRVIWAMYMGDWPT